jgi:hypothetical protein
MIAAMEDGSGRGQSWAGEARGEARREARGEWRWALPRVLAVFLVARLLVVFCAVSVDWLVDPDPNGPAGSSLRASSAPVIGSLTSWDAVYYLGIARDGYQAGPVNGPYPETVFFPLYPAVTAAVAPLVEAVGGDLALSAVLVANAAGLLGLFAAYALARRRLSRDTALLATTLVAVAPGAVAFSMAYSDGLFLALAVGSLLAAERGGRGSRVAAGLLAALAGLTRLQGALLVVPLLLIFWRQDRGRPRPSWLLALGGPLGLADFCVAIGTLTGDPLAPILAQGAWDFGSVPAAVAEGWVVLVAALIYGTTAIVELRLLWDRWRSGVDLAGVAWGAINVAALVVARRVASLPRYIAPVTQLAEQMAAGGYGPRIVRFALASSIGAYVALALLHFSLKLAP